MIWPHFCPTPRPEIAIDPGGLHGRDGRSMSNFSEIIVFECVPPTPDFSPEDPLVGNRLLFGTRILFFHTWLEHINQSLYYWLLSPKDPHILALPHGVTHSRPFYARSFVPYRPCFPATTSVHGPLNYVPGSPALRRRTAHTVTRARVISE